MNGPARHKRPNTIQARDVKSSNKVAATGQWMALCWQKDAKIQVEAVNSGANPSEKMQKYKI